MKFTFWWSRCRQINKICFQEATAIETIKEDRGIENDKKGGGRIRWSSSPGQVFELIPTIRRYAAREKWVKISGPMKQ